MSNDSDPDLPSADVLRHVVDVHCHPTDAPGGVSVDSMDKLDITICAMSSMESDQGKVRELGTRYPEKVVPCFGYHPWFSHLISITPPAARSSDCDAPPPPSSPDKEEHYRQLFLSSSAPTEHSIGASSSNDNALEIEFRTLLPSLPEPRPLSQVLAEARENLVAFPSAMLGEVGLDRAFRVPVDYHAAPRVLTSFSIPLEHQIALLEAQLELAVELGRNVSIHSVKAQQATIELLARMKKKHGAERWNRISVDMHSCGLSPQTWRDLERKHENIFLSLSTVINHKHANHRSLIASCSPNRILVESDYHDITKCTSQTWDMIKIVAEVKGWPIETEWVDGDQLEEEKWGVVRRLE
ncbi:hypothetical protein M413DRAFT_22133 [Hebeloma cylindrosporum]|uniref:TatD DNase family Scn1 n=1 Tax=Hebeloma cylindrosporum TaxID=76867 RepID=A0A0C2YC82_HEBCY|nr:hypothetical protein M413DRAFT_22133 [Hebeloma cylindrosporum h7]